MAMAASLVASATPEEVCRRNSNFKTGDALRVAAQQHSYRPSSAPDTGSFPPHLHPKAGPVEQPRFFATDLYSSMKSRPSLATASFEP